MKRVINRLLEMSLGVNVFRVRPSRVTGAFPDGSRRAYQEALFNFDLPPHASVLDIGSGPAPFHRATVLCERDLGPTVHRRGDFQARGLPLVRGSVDALPFASKSFDFVYCAHVLEHVDDPLRACQEIMRVGRRGYLETPNFMKDALFCQAHGMHHRWHTVAQGSTLLFLEYSPRQQEGICSSAWSDLIWNRRHHPLQDAFLDNQDMFNTMFAWSGGFRAVVVRQDGTTTTAEPPAGVTP